MSLIRRYLAEIWQGLGYHAAWLPNEPVRLGDIGRVVDGRFESVTTLNGLGIDLPSAESKAKIDLQYISKGKSQVAFKPEARAIDAAGVRIEVRMSREGAVVFAAKGCRTTRISDRDVLSRRLKDLHAIGSWDMSYAVVTELVTTASATILVSNSASAEVDLSAEGKLGDVLGLADASLGLRLDRASGLAAQVLAASAITPLFALSGLRRKAFGGVEMTTRGSSPGESTGASFDLKDLSPDETCPP
jgi:hypothetical protein